ncbi:MAG: SANT/Myb-like DNA-binding domain-containing protein [archaeon]|nr:SANT/Myb-like DNA-binding domain-containing protein [archaeon]
MSTKKETKGTTKKRSAKHKMFIVRTPKIITNISKAVKRKKLFIIRVQNTYIKPPKVIVVNNTKPQPEAKEPMPAPIVNIQNQIQIKVNQPITGGNLHTIKRLKRRLNFQYTTDKGFTKAEKKNTKPKDAQEAKIKKPKITSIPQNSPGPKTEGQYEVGRWKLEEHERFVEALINYGNDWKKIQKSVGTRSSTQVRHLMNY